MINVYLSSTTSLIKEKKWSLSSTRWPKYAL